jgi:D-alanyl-D-alanine dipeptidase
MRLSLTIWSLLLPLSALAIPAEFVEVREVDPTIQVEMRYFGDHNFVGRRVKGYQAAKCLLARPAAVALAKAQTELRSRKLSLKVYDCYRPQRAVNDFMEWAKDAADTKTKGEFYPKVNKRDVFRLGYVASKSGHSRGATLDLTVVPEPFPASETYKAGDPLRDCTLPATKRFRDGSLDMGTGYDCFDPLASTDNPKIGETARKNRAILKTAMEKAGFQNYEKEWWHYTLKDEPFLATYFDFPIE